jgi:hypothetical protein
VTFLSSQKKNPPPKQYPVFWSEDWLERAIHKLDSRAMSPEKRMACEMAITAQVQAKKYEQSKLKSA